MLHIEDKSVPQADLAALAKEAHEICPYSHATGDNVEVELEVGRLICGGAGAGVRLKLANAKGKPK